MNPFRRPHWKATAACLLAAVAALFLAQLPNDTRSEWFRSLARPEVLPPELERRIGLIWTTLFVLAGLGTAASLAADQPRRDKLLQVGLILTSLGLNLAYTATFTRLHDLWAATGIAAALATVLAGLVVAVARAGVWLAVVCHLPHLGWVTFATYVTARMAQLNS